MGVSFVLNIIPRTVAYVPIPTFFLSSEGGTPTHQTICIGVISHLPLAVVRRGRRRGWLDKSLPPPSQKSEFFTIV